MIRRQPRLNRVRSPQTPRRGAALYVAVTGTTMIVSVLALSSMAIVRIEREQAMAVNARQIARSQSRSGVELALQRINSDPSWRSNHTNGVETTALSLGNASAGSISWSLRDTDGDLTNSDGVLRLKGIGRIGSTVQVSSVEVRAGETTALLRNHELKNGLGIPIDPANVDIASNDWWGQYFEPSLPANANGWRITGVEIRARRINTRDFRVRLYQASGGNEPAGTIIESFTRSSTGISNSSFAWVSIPFAGSTRLEAGQGVSMMVETDAGLVPIEVSHNNSSGSGSDAALLRGDSGGLDSIDPNRSLQYRIHGTYTTSDDIQPIAGTWDWDVP
jgi:hypothetical protein